ncbi:RICIN domain-containing protein [Saccharothrix hoggarensis]|uniref:RICIN domain-containing protein n=1 Tax=Saccharothrix hoggarensis TaxID=913853 RepID=A0ABW3QRV2_9PSEU
MHGFARLLRTALVAGAVTAAVAAAAPAASANTATANATAAAFTAKVVNANSDKCLAIPGGTSREFTQAIQFSCYPPGDSKEWRVSRLYTDGYGNPVYGLENVASGLCLSIAVESTSNGAQVWQEDCSASPFQKWAYDKGIRLRNVATGKCMAVPNGWQSDGVGIIQWPCGTGAEQRWYVG